MSCASEKGAAIVELALVLPLVAILLGIAFTGWIAMHRDISLTSAARVGALIAATDLGGGKSVGTAQTDATNAINNEEGTTTYQSTNSAADNYVGLSTATSTVGDVANVQMVTISISQKVTAAIPVVVGLTVRVHAVARFK